MKVYHDTRDEKCRWPYGAVAVKTPVSLALDVWDAPDITVELRTWVDGVGEARYAMERNDGRAGEGEPTCYRTTLHPDDAGIVWYQFVITADDGRELRYGAHDGRTGGEGRLVDWEPPSFKLAVYDPAEMEAEARSAAADRAFENALVAFLQRSITAFDLANAVDDLCESFPENVVAEALDIVANPHPAHLLARLAGSKASVAPADGCPDTDISKYGLEGWQMDMAKGRLWLASLIEMALAGSLGGSIAGDDAAACSEAATKHVAELWRQVDGDCAEIVANAADLFRALPVFAEGTPSYLALNEDVFGIMRGGQAVGGQAACVLVNASTHLVHEAVVPLAGEAVSDVLDGFDVPVVAKTDIPEMDSLYFGDTLDIADRFAHVYLGQSRSSVLYFHPHARLNREMEPGVGVLAHVTSLPARGRAGTLGATARKFVDWLAKAGVRYWQVLPVNPTDSFNSPYAGISAFAGNARLLEGGFDPATFAASETASAIDETAFEEFCEREADWLEPYACFMAIRRKVGEDIAWQDWPEAYRTYDPAIVADDAELSAAADIWRRAQFVFDQQWRDLRAYANARGVQIVGDMPIYVNSDSADAWAYPEIFQLGSDGRPAVVAGCPPDRFAEDGQVWGNPVYDWDKLADEGYDWWMRRLERAFDLYDWVRLDHFIGFARYFSIPAGHKAFDGVYRPGPGEDLFRAAYRSFGPLPIIAEDLGTITPAIRALDAVCGFPGMDIVQFVDGNDPLSGYRPRPEKVTYTGTHDNQTLVGYCADRYPDLDAREAALEIMDKVLTCNAPVAVIPLQDVIGLGDEARMNVPGTAGGNWAWQAKASEIKGASEALHDIVETHRKAHA